MKNLQLSLSHALLSIGFALLLLIIPFVGTLLSDEVSWGPMDYVIGGGLLTGLFLAISILYRAGKTKIRKVTFVLITLLIFLLVWLELAIGIFNSPLAGS